MRTGLFGRARQGRRRGRQKSPSGPPTRVALQRPGGPHPSWRDETLIVSALRPSQTACKLLTRHARVMREPFAAGEANDEAAGRIAWVRPYVVAEWAGLDPRDDFESLRPWLESACWGRDVGSATERSLSAQQARCRR